MPPRKRNLDENLNLKEPVLTDKQHKEFLKGIDEFNSELFFEAHESFENVWKEMIVDSEIILRGLVQLSAGMHCIQTGRMSHAEINFKKAKPKLDLINTHFLGINILKLIDFIKEYERNPTKNIFCKIESAT